MARFSEIDDGKPTKQTKKQAGVSRESVSSVPNPKNKKDT